MTSPARKVSLFRNGRSQAIRIPKEFELPGTEATIVKDGNRLIIEPVREEDDAERTPRDAGTRWMSSSPRSRIFLPIPSKSERCGISSIPTSRPT